MQNSAEAFDCREFELAQILDPHQTRGFGTQELRKRYPQPFRKLVREVFHRPL